jgi:hypothetical protein
VHLPRQLPVGFGEFLEGLDADKHAGVVTTISMGPSSASTVRTAARIESGSVRSKRNPDGPHAAAIKGGDGCVELFVASEAVSDVEIITASRQVGDGNGGPHLSERQCRCEPHALGTRRSGDQRHLVR